jgi:uncharacterized membrane protein (UPF0127 family)
MARGPVTVVLRQGDRVLTVRAEVAATPAARARGLMGRAALAPGTGMLFLFPAPVRAGFWMKGTLVPLDIAFIREGRVAEVRSMTPCRADPCPLTVPDAAFDAALEVPAGTFAEAGVGPGAVLEVVGPLPSPV